MIQRLCTHCVVSMAGEIFLVPTMSFVGSLRLAKLNEEMKESDCGVQGWTTFKLTN